MYKKIYLRDISIKEILSKKYSKKYYVRVPEIGSAEIQRTEEGESYLSKTKFIYSLGKRKKGE